MLGMRRLSRAAFVAFVLVGLLGAAAVGIAVGFAAWVMTQAVYRSEDLFKKLTGHLHWMWWPMIGGLIIGLGGLIDPRALGVGYDTIHAELLGQLGIGALLLLGWRATVAARSPTDATIG